MTPGNLGGRSDDLDGRTNVTRKPRTAPLRSRAPRAALGSALVAGALLASGCQSHVGTAADVGGTRISTDTLNATYNRVAATQGATPGAALQRQVLNFLVTYQQAAAVAGKLHVTPTKGEIDAEFTALEDQVKASNQAAPDDEVRLVAQTQAVQGALNDYFLAHGGTADSAEVTIFPAKDAATGKLAAGKVATDGSNLTTLATTYGQGAPQRAQVGYATVKELAGLKKGQAISATVNGQNGPQAYVFYVDRPTDQAAVQQAIGNVKVSVNPRFGSWGNDASSGGLAVVPATNLLSKADPSKPADTTTPAASAPPAAPASAPSS
jgi:hypothetical protein